MGVDFDRLRKFKPQDYDKRELIAHANYVINNYKDFTYVIGTEELAELSQAMSKFLRFEGDKRSTTHNRQDVCEELADAYFVLEMYRQRAGVSMDDLHQMMAYKICKRRDLMSRGWFIRPTTQV